MYMYKSTVDYNHTYTPMTIHFNEIYRLKHVFTPPKTNMDTQNDGLEKVTPFEYGHFGYLC